MKTKVDLVTGFLDSGKTTFINGMLENKELSKERIIIIQCEAGETTIDNALVKGKNIFIRTLEKDAVIDNEYIAALLNKFYPDRIIIEHNGMADLEGVLKLFEDKNIRKRAVINKIVNTVDALTFDVFMNNMGSILIKQISYSDIILLNKADKLPQDKIANIEKTLKALNKAAEVARASICDEKVSHKDSKPILMTAFLIVFVGYMFFLLLSSLKSISTSNDFTWLQSFNTVFLSILMQAFPFILVGIFVSSFLQVFIPSEVLVKIFPKKMGLGFIVAVFAGVLFPVCDCAIVPVAARLVKKGVPLPAAITFMLSAPLVNPIVIASTFYAFPGQPQIAFYRLYFGVTIAVATGLTLMFFPEKKSILRDNMKALSCNCGYCGENNVNTKGVLLKIHSVFKHAGAEFFEVGKFLVIGAFISSIMQTFIPKDIFNGILGNSIISLLIMMTAAYVFSVCSTSDAFIARTFVNQFPIGSVMGFLVLGPMLDFKNMLMLLSSFKKRFVIKLIITVSGFTFAILSFAILFLFFK